MKINGSSLFYGYIIIISIIILLLFKHNILSFSPDLMPVSYSAFITTYILFRFGTASLYKEYKFEKNYIPSVSLIIPVFNEEKAISNTIRKWCEIDYPVDKMEIIVINDGSTDQTKEKIEMVKAEPHWHRAKFISYDQNKGKRSAQKIGFDIAHNEIIVVVDSDSTPANTQAIKHLVQPFKDKKVGGVCGHTDVANYKTNWITKTQKVRYWNAFDRNKAAEAYFESVICLSGCFSAIRRDALNQCVDEWFNQTFLGTRASYGDDRAMTTLLLKHNWKTVYAPKAKALTIVPDNFKKLWNQQLRWQKSFLRETYLGSLFLWRRPKAALQFYTGAFVTFESFLVATYTIWLSPIFSLGQFWPTLYLTGILIVSLLYAINYHRQFKDNLWVYAPIWSLLAAVVLIWRLPIALTEMSDSKWKTR